MHARDPDERDAFRPERDQTRFRPTVGAPSCAGRWRSCARPASTCPAPSWPSPATCPPAPGSPPRPRWRPRSRLALLALAGAEEPDRVELARLCSRVENDWVGAETGLLDQLASLCCERGSALRIDFATLELERVPLDLRGWRLATLGLGRHPRARRRRLQRPPRRVPRDLRAAGDRARQPRGPGRGGRAARAARPPRAPRAHRERARRRDGHGAAGGRPARPRGGCWTRRTRACATTTRRACRRSRPRCAPARTRAPRARGWSAAASAARCSRCSRRASALAAGAVAVEPGPAAALVG